MRLSVLALAALPLFLTACVEATSPDGVMAELPENVLALAAPYQDLTQVRIDPADGCYVYRYRGPVETTWLPLRATNGRPICTQAPETVATAS